MRAPNSSPISSTASRRDRRFLTESVATASLKPRAERPRAQLGWQLGARDGPAVRAALAMEPMLGHPDGDLGQLGELVAGRIAERFAPRLAEAVPAATALGPVLNYQVHRLCRQQPASTAGMARLRTLPSFRRALSPALGRAGRILAGGRGRVAGVAIQAPLELGDALALLGHTLAESGHLLPQQRVLRRQLHRHRDDRLTALLVDRLRLGAPRRRDIRRERPGACLCHLTPPDRTD